jgi:hypothetical protein
METVFVKRYRIDRRGPNMSNQIDESLKNEIYEYRFKNLHLTSMETRRLRRDLIEVFKMFRGMDNLDVRQYFFS